MAASFGAGTSWLSDRADLNDWLSFLRCLHALAVKSAAMFHAFAVTSCGVCVNCRGLDLSGKSSALHRPRVAFPAYMDRVRSLLFSSQSDVCDSCLTIADSSRKRVCRVMGENTDIRWRVV